MEKGRTQMKRVFVGILVVAIFVLVWITYQFVNIQYKVIEPVSSTDPVPTPTPIQPEPTLTVGNTTYSYATIKVATGSSITLIPNFGVNLDAKSLADNNQCQEAINGGFYDTAGKPLGFFYANTRMYGTKISSPLVNGFFWTDTNGGALISSDLPHSSYRFAIQTGPLILFNGQALQLTIAQDEHARRMIVGKTSDDRFIFLAVYTADSVYSGPLLSELPSVVDSISRKENLGIADAVNLDGGSASAFYNGETSLSELTPVGSIFCIK
jgi:uncharacterized protein YigE (DUF2233 family)